MVRTTLRQALEVNVRAIRREAGASFRDTVKLLRARALPLRVFLGTFRSHLALDRRQQLRRVIELAGLHHQPDLARVADVLERVATDDEEIRELAGLEGAELRVDVERARAVDRRHP